ncbi:hypothetical protein XELAEV_18040471mg [Xenopus laevis]|nr:hypothetical protein XELAEV_18040471mg [Xenopus laevis]
MIPFCGRCEMETPEALEDLNGTCSQFENAPLPAVISPEGDTTCTAAVVILLLPPDLAAELSTTDALVSPDNAITLVETGNDPLMHLREDHMMAAVAVPLEGDVGAQRAIVAPVCQILPSLRQGESMARVLQVLGANADVTPSADSTLVTLDEESLQPSLMLEEAENPEACEELQAPSETNALEGQDIPVGVSSPICASEEEIMAVDQEAAKVVALMHPVSDFSSPGHLTVTIYTALAELPPAPVIDYGIDWGRFSFGGPGPILPVAPTFRNQPLPESQIEKELTSLLEDDEDLESVSENADQIRYKCQRTMVSEPVKSSNPKVMVHLTPSEPGESTHVSELYHLKWGKISLAGEKDLVAKIPKPKEDSILETAPEWEEYEEETLEPEVGPAPKVVMPHSFTAPPKIGPEEENDFWVCLDEQTPTFSGPFPECNGGALGSEKA